MLRLTIAAVAVRLLFVVVLRIDSDEPQHLHVAWAWSRGLVQYRDVFDNHFPLLHLLFAPLMAIVPEGSSVFLIARLAIAPFAIACAWLVFSIARPLIGARAAAVAALVFSVLPTWLPKSVEFRNDTLWVFFWLASLALIVGRRRPAFVWAGVAAGLCLLASVKALPLFLAHALALMMQRRWFDASAIARVLAGGAIPLGAVALFLQWHGALDEMLYATLFFNASVPVDPARRIGGAVAFAILAPLLAWRGRSAWRDGDERVRHLALFAAWYTLVILCFWPIVTHRDFLPFVALAAMWIGARHGGLRPVAPLLVAIVIAAAWYARLWRPADLSRHRVVDAVVNATAPQESVFDLKGESVFRRRAVDIIYEDVGRALTSNGTLRDHGPEQIIARRCCAAVPDSEHIPPRTRAFLREHFLERGAIRVCGSVVEGDRFVVAVPHAYAVIAREPSRIVLDGAPYRGPRFLETGLHTLERGGNERVMVMATKERL